MINKTKYIIISILILLVFTAGIIKFNYSKIAWLVFPEQYAKEVLPYPELNASIIVKQEKQYLHIESKNCTLSQINFQDTIISDEKSLSEIITNYKINSFYYTKINEGKFDNNNKLILLLENKNINPKFVCVKDLNGGLEFYKGNKETEVKVENRNITINKV